MRTYRTNDLIIQSDIPLHVENSNRRQPDLVFEALSKKIRRPRVVTWIRHLASTGGRRSLSIGKAGSGYLVCWPGLANFYVSLDTTKVTAEPMGGTSTESLGEIFLDQLMPFVLSHRRKLVLHSSAVATPTGAIVFLGPAGHGKSTLAAALGRRGFPILTDDCLVLESRGNHWYGLPSCDEVRLCPDSARKLFNLSGKKHMKRSGKLSVNSGNSALNPCREATQLRSIYILVPLPPEELHQEIAVQAVSRRDALVQLASYAFRLDNTDGERMRAEFNRLGELAESVCVSRLSFPVDFSLLEEIATISLPDSPHRKLHRRRSPARA